MAAACTGAASPAVEGPVIIAEAGASNPTVAVGANGTALVAWVGAEANASNVWVARSDRNGGFTAPVRANDIDGDAAPHAGSSLAVDQAGRLHVAWYTGAAERPGIHAAVSIDGGATFGEPQPIMTGEWVPPSQVKLAALPDGRVAATWDDRRSGSAETLIAFADAATGAVSTNTVSFAGASPAIASAGATTVAAWLDGDAVHAAWLERPAGQRPAP
jgi:hypothetical protein